MDHPPEDTTPPVVSPTEDSDALTHDSVEPIRVTAPSPIVGATVPSPIVGATVPSPIVGATVPSPIVGATVPSPITGAAVPSPLVPCVKLPKLSLKRFNGDLTKWTSFWDTFDSSIHSNPYLSKVDKFNYLSSLLESTAVESIAGLTLTSANYEEAIATLKRRFGNTQLIISHHMDALLGLTPVTSHHDLKGLRRLYDMVETHVRGLQALGVSADSYGGLLTSILMSKLPPEIQLVVSREFTEERWDAESMMKLLDKEIDARERSTTSCCPDTSIKKPHPKGLPTTAAFTTSESRSPRCVYCEQEHLSSSCTVVTNVDTRKESLRKSGRCYVCLRKYHIGRDCRSTASCSKCHGRHHVSICPRSVKPRASSDTTSEAQENPSSQAETSSQSRTSTMYVDAQTPVLLQTARLQLYNLDEAGTPPIRVKARAVMDSGSQRTYITSHLRDELHLSSSHTESLRTKAFGSTEEQESVCDVVELGLITKDGKTLRLPALVVPFICNPLTSQPISQSRESYDHLRGLELADSADAGDTLEVNMLIGSDVYWDLVTGRVLRGRCGPTAVDTKVGWVLSGPVDKQVSVSLMFTSTHALKVDSCPMYTDRSLDDRLRQFWELESLGIMKEEPSVYEKFTQQVSFDGQQYEVSLPWKEHHQPLPDNLDLCSRRLASLLKRLRQNPKLLIEYDSVIKDQLNKEIIEVVENPLSSDSNRIHYLPHHCVVRQDKATTKLRIVYDASSKTTGPALNDCLYTGPKSGQSIFDILLRFRLHRVVFAGDIEKAFLMVSVTEDDRDSLRFLWTSNIQDERTDVITLRFAHVVFGVSSSPFLLNATINHHMETYREIDPSFVDKFLSSIYVDDVSLGASNIESAYELYLKSKL